MVSDMIDTGLEMLRSGMGRGSESDGRLDRLDPRCYS